MKKPLTEDQILQLTGGGRTGTVAEWRQVAGYWRDQCEVLTRKRNLVSDQMVRLALDLVQKDDK